jgi:hypothetical protein
MPGRRTAALVLAVVCAGASVGVGASREARAQGADTERAIDAGRTAARLYEEGKWAEAYARFEEADRAAHSVVFVLYMARCQRALGDLEAATKHLERIVAEALPPDAPEPMRRAQADAASELAALREERKRAEERARPAATTPAPARTAPPAPPPPAGRPGPLWPGVLVLGAGVIGLGVGGVTGAMAMSETSTIEEGCVGDHCLPSDAGRGERASTLAAVSTASFIAGGVLAAAGVVLLVVRPGGDAGATVGALSTLSVSASSRGAWLSGRF